jgi:hypothetical protein
MRPSIVWQNLSGILPTIRSANIASSVRHNTRSFALSCPLSHSFLPATRHRADLKEIFERIQWPRTRQEEAEVLEGVRSAIWDDPSGRMLRQFKTPFIAWSAN